MRDKTSTENPANRLSSLLGAEETLELLVEHVPALVFVKDEDFRIVAANQAFLELYPENERQDVVGTTTVEQFDEEQRDRFLEQDRIALRDGFTETTETIDFPNGDRRTLLTRKVGYSSRAGDRYAIGISSDITELERTRTQAGQLGQIIDVALNEILIFDATTAQIRLANTRALENLGYSRDELTKLTVFDLVPERHEAELRRTWAAMTGGEIDRALMDFEALRKDGSVYEVELLAYRSSFESDPIIVSVALDTTEMTANRRALKRKNDELMEFAYRTSHDLRAPVVTASALLSRASDFLEAGPDHAGDARKAVDHANRILSRLNVLTLDIARIARIDTADQVVKEIDLRDLIDTAVERALVPDLPADIRIEQEIGSASSFHASEDSLATILENLLSNAVKFYDPAEADPFVRISVERPTPRELVVEVSDNGIGIPPGRANELFRMFTRLHPRHSQGSGLGLYIVRRTAERMGGSVEYVPRTKGSTFRVVVPEARRS